MKFFPALLSAVAFSALSCSLHAQTTPAAPTRTPGVAVSDVEKPARDMIMLQFTYEGWAKTPDSINTVGFGRGFNGYLCYDFPIQHSRFSFAAGVGVGVSNIYFDNQQLIRTDTGTAGTSVRFVSELLDYKKYKLSTTYLEAPFELRFFGNNKNRNKGFKAAIGGRAGILVAASTKGRRSVDGDRVVDKISTKRYLEKWRFSGTVRLGWGNFSVFGSYNLNSLFKEGAGPDVVPYSVGLCISGL